MPRAFSISSESIAKERERVGGDMSKFDISRVVQLDELVLPRARPVRRAAAHPRGVGRAQRRPRGARRHVNIAEVRGGKIYPGNSAVGEVIAVGRP